MKESRSLMIMTIILSVAALVIGMIIWSRTDIQSEAVAAPAAKEFRNYINVPIIMYHSVLPDASKQGDYVVTPSQLEGDLAYLKENGYKAVTLDSLIGYCEFKNELPEKPVVITFDDGQLNNLTYALPLLERYDFCAAFSVVGRYMEAACEDAEPSPAYSYLDVDDVKQLLESGRAELVNHSYDFHSLAERRGALQKSNESYKDYQRAMLNDTSTAQRLFKEKLGTQPQVYAYPYGLVCEAGKNVINMLGFKAALDCQEKPNHLVRGSTSALFELHRYNRPAELSTEEFMRRALAE